jgi:hypothetical protein
LNSIEQISKESVKLLEEMYGMKDHTPLIPKLEALIDRNNDQLKEIGVGHEKLDEVQKSPPFFASYFDLNGITKGDKYIA